MGPRAFCILLISAFSAMLGLGVISPFLPAFAKAHGANGFWLGMIFAGFGISRGVIMPLISVLSEKVGRKIFVAGGLLLFSLVSLLYPHAEDVYSLTAVRIIHGLSSGMIIPIVLAYAGDFAKQGTEGAITAKMNTMFYLGLAAGPLLGGFLDQNYGFDSVFFAMSALGGFCFLITVIFLPDLKSTSEHHVEEGIPFFRLLRFNFIKAVLVMAVITTLFVVAFMSFMPSVAETDNIDPVHIGIIISIGIFLAGVLQIPFGKLSDKFDPPGKMIQVSLGSSVGMFALFAVPFCPDFHGLLISGIFVGLGAAISTPALLAMAVGIGKKAGMARWMGIFNSFMCLGYVITPILAGVVMDHLGVDSVFYLFGIAGLCGVALAGRYFHRRVLGLKTR